MTTIEDNCSNSSNNHSCILFANEVKPEKFKVLDKISRYQKSSWSAKILYGKETLKLQTPPLLCAFDLSSYKYEDKKECKKNYSISLSLDPEINGVTAFKDLLNNIDKMAQNTFKEDCAECTFVSSIKESKDNKYPQMLRCKLVNNFKRFKFKFTVNGKHQNDSIENVQKILVKGTRVTAVVQLNPVWKVKNKFGVSYQILGLNIIRPEILFRDFDHDE